MVVASVVVQEAAWVEYVKVQTASQAAELGSVSVPEEVWSASLAAAQRRASA